jgi:DNA helicase-4
LLEEIEKNKYISKKEINTLKEKYKLNYNNAKKFNKLLSLSNWKFRYTYKNIDKIINKKNKKFLIEEENKYNDLLSNINGKSLDNEQRKVVLTDEDNLLVVAGAGSGKTLTMLGKIIYLIKVKKINPSKILCISFTNAITEDFKLSLKKVTDEHIDVMTFHKLGVSIFRYNGIYVEIVSEKLLKNIILENVNNKRTQLTISFTIFKKNC